MESIFDLQALPVAGHRDAGPAMPYGSTLSLLICEDDDHDHWWDD